MDVRCEKCQTEYELDESRLKPGGVTVKCTNCGHMFKIRKRSNTNVGLATASSVAAASAAPPTVDRGRPPSKPGAPPVVISPSSARQQSRAQSEAPVDINDAPSGPNSERQWLVRLENGETKTCRELATLQQWIVAGIVGRESLISRTGKTWKRLGDISELGQYFLIADEARVQRAQRPTGGKPGMPAATMLGVGPGPQGEEDDLRTTGNYRSRPKTPPPPPAPKANPMAQTELAPASGPIVQQPKLPSGPVPTVKAAPAAPPVKAAPAVPPGRETAAWAASDIKATDSMAAMPQGPRGGKLSAGVDEPAFAGRVRVEPSDRSTFDGKVATDDVDDDVYPSSRGSRAGMWIALISLLVIGAAAGAVYMFVFNKKSPAATAAAPQDAAAATTADAQAAVATAPIDAQAEVPGNPLDNARAELVAGVHARMKSTVEGLSGKDDPSSLAVRARLWTALAQGMQDRAGFVDKAEADKLRKEAKQIVVDAAPLAQRAYNGQADNADANLAMADVLRLQGKPAPSVKRYLATAKTKAATDKHILTSVALGEAQLSLRDGKLPDAQAALQAADAPADDMRVKLAQALVAYAQSKPADAKAQIDQILATQPDHDVALAMYKKLETSVAHTDPLPPEDGQPSGSGKTTTTTPPPNNNNGGGGGGGGGGNDYDSLLARANKLAETSCAKAMDLFTKALEQKPNGVEALTGMGYCHLDSKQFSSAFSKFRAALAVSPRFEPALGGVAETYQRQGNKQAAIDAWNRYLEVFPASPKAKKQLELLGVTDGGAKPDSGGATPPSGGGGGEDSSAPAPAPAPAPPAPAAGSAT
ncbi:MAG: hypothetical protein HOV81_02820 [Kofleriaceae bacterium]|nr:hypothetical protein [Kofleriaceae bacterium]